MAVRDATVGPESGTTRVSGWTVGFLAVLAMLAWATDYVAALLGAKKADLPAIWEDLGKAGMVIAQQVEGDLGGDGDFSADPRVPIIVGQYLFSRVLMLAPISGYAPGLDAVKFLILPIMLSLLSRLKMIAEPWDIGPGGYQLGGFPPGWLEWNDQFRDTMRGWWLRGAGDRGAVGQERARCRGGQAGAARPRCG